MNCPRCQAHNVADARFCEECGARLTLSCPSCGAALGEGKKFCRSCGTALSPVSTAPFGQFGSLESYTPKHLAERILLSRDALKGERKQVTVLFADLKGSMELLAERDPEEARRLLDPVLERMMEAVHRYEGTVNQVMGDGIMALFGAPLALEDHAVRACYAALAMQSAVQSYSEQLRGSEGVEVEIRVGLNSGEVVVRAVGSDLRLDYTAVGATTHLAARMEQLASPGTTRLTGDTLGLAEGFVKVAHLGPVPVKGLEDPIEVFELIGAESARTRLQAAATRGLTRFVGRSAELAQMVSSLERSHAGHGQVVALVGEPGVGKSRLVWEFTRSHRTEDCLVLESASVSYGKASAYRPVIDLLKGYFQIEERDDARRKREKVIGKLLTLDEALKPMLTPLLALLDVALDDPTWDLLESAQKRIRTLDACRRLLLREAQLQPLVVVFEDLHWIDNETQALLDALVESLPTAQILLLVNFRPEYHPRWTTKTYYSQLRIDPLAGEGAEDLVRMLLGTDPSIQPLAQLLIKRTEGNPLYLEESVRALVETKALQGSRGAYRLTAQLTSLQVPATVQAILAARIDRLAPGDKQLLQAAAVIGKDVPYSLLQPVAELPEDMLREHLGNLQAAEFLYEKSIYPDLEYTFKHALTHEVAYGSLLQERRKALHNRIMESLERLSRDRQAEQVEGLAHHALRGEVWDKALRYLRQAGDKAYGRSALREAAAAYAQALAAVTHLPENQESVEQAVDLHLLIRTPLLVVGDLTRLLDYGREADALSKKLSDPRRQGWVCGMICHACVMLADFPEAISYGHRALSIAAELGDENLTAATNYYLGMIHMLRGNHREAIQFLLLSTKAPITNVRELQTPAPGGPMFAFRFAGAAAYTWSQAYAACSFAELGNFDEAIARGKESERSANVLDVTLSRAGSQWSLGFVHLRMGNLDRAVPLLEGCLQLARTADLPVLVVMVASQLGCAYNLLDRSAESIELLENVRAMADATSNFAFAPLIYGYLGEAYGLSGRTEEALGTLTQAIDLVRGHEERGYEAWTLYLMARVQAFSERSGGDHVRDAYAQCLALANELEMRPLQAQCHLGFGEFMGKKAENQRAVEQLNTAAEMFRGMGMQFWLAKTESAQRAI